MDGMKFSISSNNDCVKNTYNSLRMMIERNLERSVAVLRKSPVSCNRIKKTLCIIKLALTFCKNISF